LICHKSSSEKKDPLLSATCHQFKTINLLSPLSIQAPKTSGILRYIKKNKWEEGGGREGRRNQ
jgi:hypothetical protein